MSVGCPVSIAFGGAGLIMRVGAIAVNRKRSVTGTDQVVLLVWILRRVVLVADWQQQARTVRKRSHGYPEN
jgi:hypothetical protein